MPSLPCRPLPCTSTQGLVHQVQSARTVPSSAIDGSQKFTRDVLWDEPLLERQVGAEDARHAQYFVYVLEASLAFHNGLLIPLLSEFLDYAKGETTADQQDCERRAFARLSARIKALFPRLPILLLRDGLDANGPVMQRCHQYHLQFMIVLKDQDLSTVWEEFYALHAVQPNGCQHHWGTRRQRFAWVNAIDYAFSNNARCHLKVHVVVCEETWETIDAHLFNTLARCARHLRDIYGQLGVRGAIAFIRTSCAGPWLDPARMRRLLAQPLQLQLE